ncbi:radical SAM protein [Desulfopila aestuarii]|uniref:Radical SAM superfamily enzyme, MoaA/NifB/PqqE/SkfB family n=1 Tax=Desulfopila aestuarii DSM 18488 TaxID=1121416 RepID=A0A1M7Y208_9BACT|nr:radical SAM protein [Desulfopila aestuarii]SHO45651.1 Radical SAM superfamily enzyme, MoaA/NifB/PqqE/SkfB family [Desulfopila aestuarii DSM 18488]
MNHVPRTVGFKPGERNIFFHILTACNLSCSHCYINPKQHGTQALDIATIQSWLKLFAAPGKKSNVIFLGGEPTMHPDLPEAVRFAKTLGFDVTVDSNGYLFHDFLYKVTPNELDYLSFSLDGPDAQINDPIRGEGVFDVCTTHLQQAVQLGFNVSVIYTVSRRNIGHLHRMVAVLTGFGVKKFFIQVIGLRGKSATRQAGDESGVQVSREEWLAVVPQVARQAAEAGIHVTYPKVFLDANETFGCAGVVAENYFIFPNGRVYQCPLCEDHPVNSYRIENNLLVKNSGLTEDRFFQLNIGEGCVMNKLLQPDTIEYDEEGRPQHRISCCLLKQEIG